MVVGSVGSPGRAIILNFQLDVDARIGYYLSLIVVTPYYDWSTIRN